MSIMPSISPSEFVARFTSSGATPPLSVQPVIVGSTDPDREADQQVVGATFEQIGGWVKKAASLAYRASPLGIAESVAVPLAEGVADAGAGVKASLTGSVGAVTEGISSTFSTLKWTLVIVLVVAAIYVATLLAQPIIAARSLAK